ncbi:exodeoxyribonuclease V subunit alpha [Paraglaciecola hydrolytica]|uniref:RecBCD enzyme subunit RecD n=1 Tax=Paraglaciecola hydrolytica TaxID=1799789 RepID=A0A136A660_9ALTE|nr:exodeoxyribonuclease V subunit alpha [Paraglaciecola hydrolytica]KXI30713.1 exodeoxyribonuclease V subunit alpha [Paraglaciecola hydrolytica]
MVTQSPMAQPLNTLPSILEQLQTQGLIRPLDKAFALFIADGLGEQQNTAILNISLLAAYLSASLGEQHSCIELTELNQPFAPWFEFVEHPSLMTYLQQSTLVEVIKLPLAEAKLSCNKPIVVEGSRLYLQRYWLYEGELASQILARASQQKDVDQQSAIALLNSLFSGDSTESIDWQKVAVCVAARQMISFITGGPGTGKTTTVTKLLALLQGLAREQGKVLNIKLVAPTGKAAARLTESISAARQKLPAQLQQDLPEQCQTIHRLLGAKPLSPYFNANSAQPLHLDVLVVDEASMVDLPLMSKLFAALPTHAQVILLGDKDQLASVEAGSVLSDICAAVLVDDKQVASLASYSEPMQQQLHSWLQLSAQQISQDANAPHTAYQSQIKDNLVMLQKSHRFSADSGIGQLAQLINQGQITQSMQLLTKKMTQQSLADIEWTVPQALTRQGVIDEQLQSLILKLMFGYRAYFSAVKQGDLAAAFTSLGQQQVLCAQRSGAWGITQLNDVIEQELNAQGLIQRSQDFYAGRPLILTRNDHNLKLFNGDIGIVMADPQEPSLTKVWFNMADGSIRGFLPNRIPPHDTLYAMTIHKSQGSEFAAVHLCLPLINQISKGRGLSRELLYTGLTRAKQHFSLYAQQQALQICLKQQCVRGSGLAQRLA